jgi:hypothetical protein
MMMKNIFMLLFAAGLLVPAFSQTAVIRELSGTVEVKRSANAAWTPASAGMRLERGMSVSTGFRSTALISLGSSTVAVRPLTRISLEELAASRGTENTALFLQAGRVRANVAPPAGGGKANFQVRSPTATASVRGTEFDMDPSNVKMYSGAVAFAGSDGVSAIVGAGQSAYGGAASQVSSGLVPNLPLGIRPQAGVPAPAASPEGSVTGSIGWYGQKP